MGRPRIYHEPRVATAVRLPGSLRAELRAVALERKVSVNLLVTCAVREYLRRLRTVDCETSAEAEARSRRRPADAKASS